jgi:oligosaccharide repeat unit polymerase
MSLARILLGTGSIFTCLICGYALSQGGYPVNWSPWVVGLSLSWLCLFLATTWSHLGSIYQFTVVYAIMLMLFHLGITVPDAFGLMDELNWENFTPNQWAAMGGWCTCLALGSYGFGVAAGMKSEQEPDGSYRPLLPHERDRFQLSFECGLALLAASILLLAWTTAKVGNLLNFSRVDFFRGVGDTRGFGVALMALPSAAVLLVICASTRTQRWVGGIAAAFIALVLMLSGYRTSVLYPLMTGAVLWYKLVARIPATLAAGAVAGVMMLIPIMGFLRAAGPYKDMNVELIRESAKTATVAEAFRTMGQTGGLVGEIIRLVPREDPFRYGSSYLQGLVSSIPNVSGTISASQRELTAKSNFLEPERFSALPPSDWMTYRLIPEKFGTGEGTGFTSIGEAYLNFGYAGVVGFFMLLGFLLARLDAADLKSSTWLLLFACFSYWHLARTVRDELSNWVKPTVFLTVMILVFLTMRRMIWRIR